MDLMIFPSAQAPQSQRNIGRLMACSVKWITSALVCPSGTKIQSPKQTKQQAMR